MMNLLKKRNDSNPEEDDAESSPSEMSLVEHIDELRRFLIHSLIFVAIAFIIVFINKNFIFSEIILAPKEPWFVTNAFMCRMAEMSGIKALCINVSELKLINIQLAGQFSAHILVSFISGIVLAFPFILWKLWQFIKPALYSHEIKKFKGFIAICSLLFFTGLSFAYFIIVPLAINFLGSYQVTSDVENTISLMSYISTVSLISLIMGLVFQLPVLVTILVRIGILTSSFLRKNRKIVLILILALSAIISPPDAFSQFLVAVPLYILFEISIVIARRQDPKQDAVAV